jgi:membrane protein YdbS with pleckstrin-like domain
LTFPLILLYFKILRKEAIIEKDYERKEEIIEIIHPSWLSYFGHYFWSIISIFIAVAFYMYNPRIWSYFFIFVTLVIFIHAVFMRLTYTYTVTNSSVRCRIGIIARDESEIRMKDIREVGVRQSIGQRIFRIGDVYFASAGTAEVEVIFEGVRAPTKIRNIVNEIRDSTPTADKKRCPQCGEFIWINARVCPHCNYRFEGKDTFKRR